jgi:hypothetical protein
MGGGCELTREALLAGVDEARRATLPDNLRALWEVRFAAEVEGQPPPREAQNAKRIHAETDCSQVHRRPHSSPLAGQRRRVARRLCGWLLTPLL